ncbi:MAG: UPF0149 family protein [Pseudomonadales bacterium]|nr:UPF0149 family protein [Pseudomonadales bacterium]MDP6469489.1 UPF0149 family protein [Pseudomonadales bacterium]MDP6827331.1 UPF0149 family protein [Pseudomonadales bacterium]MDP6971154.1 UPF0149 family protein [Pseudomonadales bacterium]
MSDLDVLALQASHGLSSAELHGVVCGLVAADAGAFNLERLLLLVGEDALTDQFAVHAFVEAVMTELFAEDMRFLPLLPDDDETLADRTVALAQWCGSFAAGFAAAVGDLPAAPDEVGEILRDFVAISELEEAKNTNEDTERDLFELVEFAKVGALLLLATMNGDERINDASAIDAENEL